MDGCDGGKAITNPNLKGMCMVIMNQMGALLHLAEVCLDMCVHPCASHALSAGVAGLLLYPHVAALQGLLSPRNRTRKQHDSLFHSTCGC